MVPAKRRLGNDGPPLAAGEYVSTVTGAEHRTSAAGNPMIVWVFDAEGHAINHYTVKGRADAGLVAQALGLPMQFRLSEAIGRQCRVQVTHDGPYLRVNGVRPL